MLTDIKVSPTAVTTTSRTRLDGTPITPTCEFPLKPCCREVLLGDECPCGPSQAVDAAREAWDLQMVSA